MTNVMVAHLIHFTLFLAECTLCLIFSIKNYHSSSAVELLGGLLLACINRVIKILPPKGF